MRVRRTNSFTTSAVPIPPPQHVPTMNIQQPLIQTAPQTTQRNIIQSSAHRPRQLSKMSTTSTKQTQLHGWTAKTQPQLQESKMKQSKMGNAIRQRFKSIVENVSDSRSCQICQEKITKSEDDEYITITNCEHRNNFCEGCLLRYVIYRIKSSEEVDCPHSGCPAKMDSKGDFFKKLPIDVQRNYRTVKEMMQKSMTKHLKICPNDGCNGVLRQVYQNVLTCNNCSNAFCARCVLPVHDGECRSYEPHFFQVSQKYQICKWCRRPARKVEGNIRIVCTCGCQFCYVCGKNWTNQHLDGHDQFGQLKARPQNQMVHIPELEQEPVQKEFSCLKCILKVFLLVIGVPILAVVFLVRDLLVIVGVLVITIFLGLFGFSFQMITKMDGCLALFMLIFFPIAMILGIGIAFKEIFCQLGTPFIGAFLKSTSKRVKAIWNM